MRGKKFQRTDVRMNLPNLYLLPQHFQTAEAHEDIVLGEKDKWYNSKNSLKVIIVWPIYQHG